MKASRARQLLAKAGQAVPTIDTSAFDAAPAAVKAGLRGVVAVRDGADSYPMYDAQGRTRLVPGQIMGIAMDAGLTAECPFCGDTHESDDPNACPARAKVAKTRCPVPGCGKIFSDPIREGEELPVEADTDPALIAINVYDSTPQTRLEGLVRAHIVAKHRTEALMMGLPDREAVGAGR